MENFESAAKDETKALTEVRNEHFPVLKKWILNYIDDNKV